jgi:hypothetical protein
MKTECEDKFSYTLNKMEISNQPQVPAAVSPEKRVHGTHSIDGCLNIRRAVDMAKREMAAPAGNQLPVGTLSARFADRLSLA